MSDEKPKSTLEIIEEWKHFGMNQRHNSEDDFQNYFQRAVGVDANMMHHLGDLIDAHLPRRDEATLKLVEEIQKIWGGQIIGSWTEIELFKALQEWEARHGKD